MGIQIIQGHDHKLNSADINIVIDVIRAFTVAHYAFAKGAKQILLVGEVGKAYQLKKSHPDYLLAGEINGIAIEGFDLDNSPLTIMKRDVKNKTLVQKTTNGVRAALNSLDARELYVTGFSNARKTAHYTRNFYQSSNDSAEINIIASHPTGDDDLACAEYIHSIITGSYTITPEETASRINNSHVAKKFFDETNPYFQAEDIAVCSKELDSNFLMKVNQECEIPTIERFFI
ncbi:2-phosphosulfolactate phosphatase [Peribacillus glennii]|uniref:Probable 2-phosphosulfolactate phosphatase n=1 Tax=Peribacillus glennii TaxID=2303991 RepID=A0A372LH67_9BACI|nr:2-phosphosulfolactate phosphatase [Peribacillus glennii]RFU65334.1 2-phosphosulfolactate phosphatase [Peribacillus glennii]